MDLQQRIAQTDWAEATESLNDKGFASIPGMLSADECNALIANYGDDTRYRKTIQMENHGYGMGQYKYYSYPLPATVQQLRELVYPNIAPVANNWMKALGIEKTFPGRVKRANGALPSAWAKPPNATNSQIRQRRVQRHAPGSVRRDLLPHATGGMPERAGHRF
jgi:hypothetical protein